MGTEALTLLLVSAIVANGSVCTSSAGLELGFGENDPLTTRVEGERGPGGFVFSTTSDCRAWAGDADAEVDGLRFALPASAMPRAFTTPTSPTRPALIWLYLSIFAVAVSAGMSPGDL